MDDGVSGSGAGKRSDVGYKRPPREHQFKCGEKPPPRRKKAAEQISFRDTLLALLLEPRRVQVHGKIRWVPTSELLVEQAYGVADRGSPTLRRLLSELLMASEGAEADEEAVEVEVDPDAPTFTGVEIRRTRPW